MRGAHRFNMMPWRQPTLHGKVRLARCNQVASHQKRCHAKNPAAQANHVIVRTSNTPIAGGVSERVVVRLPTDCAFASLAFKVAPSFYFRQYE